MKAIFISIFITLLLSASCQNSTMTNEKNTAPKAEKIPKELVLHGDTRQDPYFWLNQREDEKVLDYLRAENTFRESEMKHTEPLQEKLFAEIKGRIKEDDQSVPYFKNEYWYYVRYEIGMEHPVYCRKKGSLEAEEEIIMNVNIEAAKHDFYQVGGLSISPNNQWLAFGEDTLSRRIYRIKFKNLATGEVLSKAIENTTGSATWASDNATLFYTIKDESLRPYKILRHQLMGSTEADELVYHEKDETFNCGVYKSKSRSYIMISSSNSVADEYQYLKADTPAGDFKIFKSRERDFEYSVTHYENHWYILTNAQGATNFKLMKCPIEDTHFDKWEEVIAHRPEVFLENADVFKEYLVTEERENGLNRINIKRWDGTAEHSIEFGEDTYSAWVGTNPEYDTQTLRYGYTSLTVPASIIDYQMDSREKKVMKQQEVVGGYDSSLYQSKRIWATADDGVKVPISLVFRKDTRNEETGNPLLLYGYGSYGATIDPGFSSTRLSLLDRGFVFAIAHIRGGQYLGRQWYENGKMLHKRNTFTDFIACAESLIEQKLTSPKQLYAMGGSAGGLLMGVVINRAPQLFNGVIAAVPFVDVVSTMLDETIPLTTGEYDEWGNPNNAEYYHYIKGYSPYDNVIAQNYPSMLVTTGLHDSQVQYWEPAKWVAKLRDLKTDNNPLYLFTNMETGHGGASGRFEAYKETAMEYAFLLMLEGIGN